MKTYHIMSMMNYKIYFVCTGNACRSPFAECVTKKLWQNTLKMVVCAWLRSGNDNNLYFCDRLGLLYPIYYHKDKKLQSYEKEIFVDSVSLSYLERDL